MMAQGGERTLDREAVMSGVFDSAGGDGLVGGFGDGQVGICARATAEVVGGHGRRSG